MDIAGPLGVSHFLILTATENAAYLRVAKTPRVRAVSPHMDSHIMSMVWDVVDAGPCCKCTF